MEKIKVNMSPNPLDVQTIHASQNDGEARQWEFELHNNGEKIDSSSISDQLVFKAYKGGTEQLLPENTSTPTTSPFLGDIKYPQGLLSDQEFTYRQSPTEEDGLAKITDVKGNTIVWNQLIPTNWASSGNGNGVTFTNNGDGSYTFNGTSTGIKFIPRSVVVSAKANHKYFVNVGNDSNTGLNITINGLTEESYVKTKAIISSPIDNNFILFYQSGASFNNLKVWPQVIDLTAMFGSGKEPTTIDGFTSLFPLSYYSYNQGSLLSFNGNGIKTVGKNLLNSVRTVGTTYTISGVRIVLREDGSYKLDGTCTGNNVLNLVTLSGVNDGVLFNKGSYVLSGSLDGTSASNVELQYYIPSIGSGNRSTLPLSFTLNEPMDVAIRIYINNGRTYNDVVYPMLRFADVEDATFEPYTSSALSLPISTYFPTGMKSAGTVYDELTESKAITRIGAVDLGSLTWTKSTNYNTVRFVTDANVVPLAKLPSNNAETANIKSRYNAFPTNDLINNSKDGIALSGVGGISVRDSAYTSGTAEAFKQAMSGVYLYYELATESETSFTTASLVTENAEIPLSNNDGILIGKCTEELSENPGFIDAKIKLADADGTCYSNKIQLHVERSPQ